MSEQLSLAGFEPPAPPTDRLFFALLPETNSAVQIADLTQRLSEEYGLKGKPVSVERLHATLYFLGDFPGLPHNLIARASRAAASVALPAFDVVFDRVMSFTGTPRNRPCVLRGSAGLDALVDFQRVLALAMSREGLKPADKSNTYTPHVTLLYDEVGVTEQAIKPISWIAREFVLVRSAIGQSRYEAIARWPLGS